MAMSDEYKELFAIAKLARASKAARKTNFAHVKTRLVDTVKNVEVHCRFTDRQAVAYRDVNDELQKYNASAKASGDESGLDNWYDKDIELGIAAEKRLATELIENAAKAAEMESEE